MVGVSGDMDVSEEDDDVALRLAQDVYIAKEADRVVNRGVRAHVDVGEELDRIRVGMGGCGGDRKGRGKQADGKHSSHHRGRLTNHYAESNQKVPNGIRQAFSFQLFTLGILGLLHLVAKVLWATPPATHV